jgi:hypothetical protein
MKSEKNISNIGQIAQFLDAECTISERMKIKKETMKRVGYAILCYLSIMMLFGLLL